MFIYKLLSNLASPIIFMFFLVRMFMTKESLTSVKSKFVLYKKKRPKGNLVWINAVSIGEAKSAESLAREIRKKNPDVNILLTTSTISSYKLMKNKKNNFYLFYSPVDIDFIIKKFLGLWNPDIVIFFESEIWPNIIHNLHVLNKQFIICNGRISENSYRNWRKVPVFRETFFSKVSICFSQDKQSMYRFRKLGVKSVKMIGNIKFLANSLSINKVDFNKFKIQIRGKKTITFFSSHPGEDEIFIRVANKLKDKLENCFFILIPRHQNRIAKICKYLKHTNFKFSLRSEKKSVNFNTNFFIVDTFGELGLFFKLSKIAIVGGSFVNKGGHNPIETKGLGCALIFGPNMQNFKQIANKIIRYDAGYQVKNEFELEKKILFLVSNPENIIKVSGNFKKLCNEEYSRCKKVVKEINAQIKNEFKST